MGFNLLIAPSSRDSYPIHQRGNTTKNEANARVAIRVARAFFGPVLSVSATNPYLNINSTPTQMNTASE